MARKRKAEYGSDSAFDYSDGAHVGCLPIIQVLVGALGLLVLGVVLMLAAIG